MAQRTRKLTKELVTEYIAKIRLGSDLSWLNPSLNLDRNRSYITLNGEWIIPYTIQGTTYSDVTFTFYINNQVIIEPTLYSSDKKDWAPLVIQVLEKALDIL